MKMLCLLLCGLTMSINAFSQGWDPYLDPRPDGFYVFVPYQGYTKLNGFDDPLEEGEVEVGTGDFWRCFEFHDGSVCFDDDGGIVD